MAIDAKPRLEAGAVSDGVVRSLLRRAIRTSFPLFSYKELKRLLRCEYHAFVCDLRQERPWSEVTMLTGMTRAGLNKLGDEIVPRDERNAIRLLNLLVQQAGAEGATAGQLAGRYFEYIGLDESGPGFREALQCLVDAGWVREDSGRFYEVVWTHPLRDADTVMDVVERITELAIDPETPELASRTTFAAPRGDAVLEQIHEEIRQAILAVGHKCEQAATAAGNNETQVVTIVYAGGRDV